MYNIIRKHATAVRKQTQNDASWGKNAHPEAVKTIRVSQKSKRQLAFFLPSSFLFFFLKGGGWSRTKLFVLTKSQW